MAHSEGQINEGAETISETSNKESLFDKYIGVISQHFAIISTFSTLFIACYVTLVLYSYFAVFDSSLIWLVEYHDIIKLCLVGIGLASGSFFFIYNIADVARSWAQMEQKRQIKYSVIVIAFFALSLAVGLYGDYNSDHPTKEYHIYSFTSTIAIIFLVAVSVITINSRAERSKYAIGLILSVLFSSFTFGRTYGLYVRDVSLQYKSFVINGMADQIEAFNKVKIVFITSHHTIIYGDGKTITLRSDDIRQIISLPVRYGAD